MALEIRPTWDPGETVSLRLCERRRELVLSVDGEVLQYVLRSERPDRLGWVERRLEGGPFRRRRVTVGEVVCACLREWEAEQLVIAASRAAAELASRRGGQWQLAGMRLRRECREARDRGRVSVLPFQVLWHHASDPHRERPLTASVAAERIGMRDRGGQVDTSALMRRLGLADHCEGGGRRRRSRAVSTDTGVALCRALGVEPVELGL